MFVQWMKLFDNIPSGNLHAFASITPSLGDSTPYSSAGSDHIVWMMFITPSKSIIIIGWFDIITGQTLPFPIPYHSSSFSTSITRIKAETTIFLVAHDDLLTTIHLNRLPFGR